MHCNEATTEIALVDKETSAPLRGKDHFTKMGKGLGKSRTHITTPT